MINNKELAERIKTGIIYFEGLKPSEWNAASITHAKILFRLMGEYLDGKDIHITQLNDEPRGVPAIGAYEKAQEIFEVKDDGFNTGIKQSQSKDHPVI